MEGADQVFTEKTVHACLSPDGAVNLGDNRRWELDHGDAPLVDGGYKSGQIPYDAPAERKDGTLSIQA